MSIKTIPEQKTYICDRCKKESKNSSFLSVRIELPGRDYQGGIVGPGGTYEFCQTCGEHDLREWIRRGK